MTVDTIVKAKTRTELQPGWRIVRFDAMAENVNDRVDDPAEAGVEYYVGLEHLDPESLKIRRWGKPTDVEATKLRFKPGDIIFGRRRAYQRKLAVAEFEGICSAHAMVLRAREDVVLPEFLPFFMQSEIFFERAMSISVGSLSPTINWKTLAAQEFTLPTRDEQHRIAETLWAMEDTIQQLKEADEKIALSHSVLMRHMLTQGVDLDNMDPEDSPIDALPEDWRWGRLGELCILSGGNGFRPPDWSSHGLPIIRIQNLNGSTDFNYFAGKPEPKWIVEPGELLYAWAGVKGVSFGPCIWPGPRGVLNQHIYRVKPRPGINKVWLYELLRVITRNIEKKAHGFKHELLHVRQADVVGQIVPIPPSSEQDWIAELSTKLFGLKSAHLQHLQRSDQLKKRLLHSLLRGDK